MREQGATHVIDYTKEDVEKEVKALTGGYGVDAWINMVTGKDAEMGIRCLNFSGEMVSILELP